MIIKPEPVIGIPWKTRHSCELFLSTNNPTLLNCKIANCVIYTLSKLTGIIVIYLRLMNHIRSVYKIFFVQRHRRLRNLTRLNQNNEFSILLQICMIESCST